MTEEVDVFEMSSWERDLGTARGSRLGPRAGSAELGCSLYELDPGAQAVPYHLHHANEELLIVLEGELELRTPDGTRMVSRGDVVGFPAGEAGAHRLRNVSDVKARYLREAADGEDLRERIAALPGFGEMKIKALGAVLAKRFGINVAEPLVPSLPTLGDVDSSQALGDYQAAKRAHKAEWTKVRAGN